jgi:hypothetical protein
MGHAAETIFITFALSCCVVMGCQRESPSENVKRPADKPAAAIEGTIHTPIEKAKAVEGTLQGAADRTANQTQKADE